MKWAEPSARLEGPLDGVRVLDLSAFAVGPWAGALLATLGADVVKVEPPYGDHIRNVRPTKRGEPTTYTVSNLGKRSILLDLKEEEGRAAALALASKADVVIENSRAGAMARLGLAFADVARVNPQIVYCSSSSFGDSGPMAAVGSTDPHGQAFSGFVSVNGEEDRDPEFLRYSAAVDLSTSACLVQCCLLGLHWRNRNGSGCNVTTSQFEGALAIQITRSAEYLVTGQEPVPLGSASAAIAPSEAYRCRDGRYIAVTASTDAHWRELCGLIAPALLDDDRFVDNRTRLAHRHELSEALGAQFAAKDLAWWRYRLDRTTVPHAEFSIIDDVVSGASSVSLARHIVAVPHPAGGTIKAGGPPWTFSRTPTRYRVAPFPAQDADQFIRPTVAVEEARSLPAAMMAERQPMSGVRVIEVAQGISGPYCGWLLACAGADVTKVEPTGPGDYLRSVEPAGPDGNSAAFSAINSGKRSVTVAAGPTGTEASLRLLDGVDVVICDGGAGEGPPWNDRWILDHVDPRTVVCRTTPLGSEQSATELEVQAMSGLSRYLGAIGDPPLRIGADMGHLLAGAFLFQAALAALLERERSGLGQLVETSALGSLASVASVMIAAVDDPDEWEGFHCRAAVYTRDYGVKTATGSISFSAPRRNDEDWFRLCAELGAEELSKRPEYAHDSGRTPRSKELNRELSHFTERLPRDEVLKATERNNALAVPVQTYSQVFSHPQVAAIDAVHSGQDGARLGPPWRFNGVRPHPRGGVPAPGQDNGLAQDSN